MSAGHAPGVIFGHCRNGANCVFPHDCMCHCAGCDPLEHGQMTFAQFREMLKRMVRDDRVSVSAARDIQAAVDAGLRDEPTPPEVVAEYAAAMRAMDDRRRSGACMARSGDEWCSLPGDHAGQHKL